MKVLSFLSLLALTLLINIEVKAQNNPMDFSDPKVPNTPSNYGIEGQKAPELDVPLWVDAQGAEMDPLLLKDLEGKFKVIYCFQAWCPGCHSRGLPALQKMTKALEGKDDVVFLAIQTVFEGSSANTYERMKEIQKEYNLAIPFGHDVGNASTRNRSTTLTNYHTGGTPWFILVDKSGEVVFNNFHLDTAKTIKFLKSL